MPVLPGVLDDKPEHDLCPVCKYKSFIVVMIDEKQGRFIGRCTNCRFIRIGDHGKKNSDE